MSVFQRTGLSAATRLLPHSLTEGFGSGLYLAEAKAFETAMDLPASLQRALAGRPVRIDGNELAVDTQLMLRLIKLAGEPDLGQVTLPRGRRALSRQTAVAGGRQPIGKVRTVESAGGLARLYVPTSRLGEEAPGPLLVFLHGGGFIFGDLDSHDPACRFLAEHSGVRVLSVNYRLAPENPFPAAYDDAVAAFDWAVEHADALGADPARIGVGGDSAGGNLAAGVALHARSRCAFQLLIYPVTTQREETDSRDTFASGFFLTREFIMAAGEGYHAEDPEDPRLSVLYAEIPADVAPAYVATAGFDPLRDEGQAYAERLRAAGVEVESRLFGSQIHGFLNVVGAGRSAKAAVIEIAGALKRSL